MYNSRHINLLSIFILILAFGCAKNEQNPSVIYNLGEEFTIRPFEILSRSGSKLSLEIRSLQEGLCSDSEILYRYRQIDGVSVIELNDITTPPNCQSGSAPSINIALSPNGSNNRLVNIMIKEIIENEGQIEEYLDRFEIKMNSTNGIKISHRELKKISPQTLWGGVDYSAVDSTSVADSFIADIANMTQAKYLPVGYYGHFEQLLSGDIQIWNDLQASTFHRSSFAFESNMTLTELSSMVDDYRSQYPQLRFFVYNAFGESL